MKLWIRAAALLAAAFALSAQAQVQNLSIATGGTGGVYYPLGGGMAAVLSKHVPGMQATAEVTGGSVANLQLIGTGKPYLAIIGGTAALETTWVEAIEDVDLDDLNPESLWRFRVRGFGPLVVAMDSHGASLYARVNEAAKARRAAALGKLGVR